MGVKTGYLVVMTVRVLCPHCHDILDVAGRTDLDARLTQMLGYSVRCGGCKKAFRMPIIPSHVGTGDPAADGRKNPIKSYARRLPRKKD